MTEVAGLFLQVAELSVSAAWMIPAVCALRLLLRRRALRRSRRPRRRRGWERIRHRARSGGVGAVGSDERAGCPVAGGIGGDAALCVFKLAAPAPAGAGGRPGRGWEIYLRQAARPIYTGTVPPAHISAFGFVGAGAGLRPGARGGAPEAEGPYLEAIGLAAAERALVQPSCLAGLRAVLPRCGVCL